MQLQLEALSSDVVEVGYVCACGCKPRLTYESGSANVEDRCCCGNRLVVGRDAESALELKEGFRHEVQEFESPWGEQLEAAWAVGPSVHGQG